MKSEYTQIILQIFPIFFGVLLIFIHRFSYSRLRMSARKGWTLMICGLFIFDFGFFIGIYFNLIRLGAIVGFVGWMGTAVGIVTMLLSKENNI